MSVITLDDKTDYIGLSYDGGYFTMIVSQRIGDAILVKEHVDLKMGVNDLIMLGKEIEKLGY